MKKLALTIAIVLGMAFASFGQNSKAVGHQGGGLFGMGDKPENQASASNRDETPLLPGTYGGNANQNAQNESAPLGSGIAVLVGLGAAYMVAKKRKEE